MRIKELHIKDFNVIREADFQDDTLLKELGFDKEKIDKILSSNQLFEWLSKKRTL